MHGFSARVFLVLGPKGEHWGPGTKMVKKRYFGSILGLFWAPEAQFSKKKNVDKATLLTWGHGLGHGQGHGHLLWALCGPVSYPTPDQPPEWPVCYRFILKVKA